MIFRNRALACVGAGFAGLLAAGVIAAPAYAADNVDLEIKLDGTTIAASSTGKDAAVSLINHSKVDDATGILVTLDISQLKTDMVEIDESGCNAPENGKILCGIKGDAIPAGADVDWAFKLTRKPGSATGAAGTITATIEHEGTDPDPKNNSVTVDVVVDGNGPDLSVYAPDVDQAAAVDADGALQLTGELNPGETAALRYLIANFGDAATTGLKIIVKLPAGVTFTEVEPDCVYAPDNRSTVCTYDAFPLVPADQDTNENDEIYSAFGFYNLLSVSANVTAPVSLTGGTVSVEPIVAEQMGIPALTAATELPENVEGMSAADVDESDNTDDFTVVVKGAGGSGGGGSLPVTGVQAGVIGGVGLGVLAVGGVLFMLARRRRVVLVTPGDEKPTA